MDFRAEHDLELMCKDQALRFTMRLTPICHFPMLVDSLNLLRCDSMINKFKNFAYPLILTPLILSADFFDGYEEVNNSDEIIQGEVFELDPSFHSDENVTVNEDLMHEHGLLNRLLLIYQEINSRFKTGIDTPEDVELLLQAATIIRDFLENHHEQMEEQFIFPIVVADDPQFEELVETLKAQHLVGRELTDFIIRSANNAAMQIFPIRLQMIECIDLYIRMFRPHEAREDTVIFPKFRAALSDDEYELMSHIFEAHEKETIGEGGFGLLVAQVEAIEKALGIYDLNNFTPAW